MHICHACLGRNIGMLYIKKHLVINLEKNPFIHTLENNDRLINDLRLYSLSKQRNDVHIDNVVVFFFNLR